MLELTGKQKRHLKRLGQELTPAAAVGHGGVTDEVLCHLRGLLERQELIKVKLPAGDDRKTAAGDVAAAVGAALVGVVGRTALLYRPGQRLEEERRIHLPQ